MSRGRLRGDPAAGAWKSRGPTGRLRGDLAAGALKKWGPTGTVRGDPAAGVGAAMAATNGRVTWAEPEASIRGPWRR